MSLASEPDGEEDPGVGDARQATDAFGELDHRLVEIQRGGVHHLRRLLLDGSGDLRVVVPDHRGEHAAEEVEIPVALGREDGTAVAVVDRDRLGEHRLHERRQRRAITLKQRSIDRQVVGNGGFHPLILDRSLIAYKALFVLYKDS